MIVYDTTIPIPDKYKYKPKQRKPIRNPIIASIAFILAIFVIPIIAGITTGDGDVNATETETDWQELEEIEHKADIKEQKYIVRYATAFDIDELGVTTYIDQNGMEWKAMDAPTEIGDVARLLFDSKETISPYDDEIIDITM